MIEGVGGVLRGGGVADARGITEVVDAVAALRALTEGRSSEAHGGVWELQGWGRRCAVGERAGVGVCADEVVFVGTAGRGCCCTCEVRVWESSGRREDWLTVQCGVSILIDLVAHMYCL